MSYDYHTYQDYKTGHNAPLYPRPDEEGIERTKNMNFTLHYLLNKGALPELYDTYKAVLPKLGGYINEGGTLNLKRFEPGPSAFAF